MRDDEQAHVGDRGSLSMETLKNMWEFVANMWEFIGSIEFGVGRRRED
jgi:hypothetical protein